MTRRLITLFAVIAVCSSCYISYQVGVQEGIDATVSAISSIEETTKKVKKTAPDEKNTTSKPIETTTKVTATTRPTTTKPETTKQTTTRAVTTTKPTTSRATTTAKPTTTQAETTTTRAETTQATTSSNSSITPAQFRRAGVIYYNGWRFTWYSERVLPGNGLRIPGRHSDENFVRDGDGYICLACEDRDKGTVIQTPWGAGKVYDCGCAHGTVDVYVTW